MCSVYKIVLINLIFLILVLAQDDVIKMYRPKCNTNLLTDITNGTRNSTTNNIVHNNITYTVNDYHTNISNPFQILGCLCNIEKCVRKCCPFGSAYDRENNTCVQNDIVSKKLQIPVHDKTDQIQVHPKDFKYVFGKNCTYGAYELDPDNYDEDEYYLQGNGSLYFPNSNTIVYKNAEDYCLDVNNAGNNSIIALACFPPPPPEPGIAYSIGISNILI